MAINCLFEELFARVLATHRRPGFDSQSRVALVEDGDEIGQLYSLHILLVYDIRLRTTATANLVADISHKKAIFKETW